ncbi:MAG: AI-2E family transporter [Candidatus Nanohalobium sp.]
MNSQRGFLLILVTSLLFVAGLMLKPFLGYILGALLLAFILMPLQDRLSNLIGDKLSALTLIVLTFVAVSVPFALIFGAVANDAQDVIGEVNQTQLFDIQKAEQIIMEYTGQQVNLEQEIREVLNQFVSTTLGGVSEFLNVLTGIAIGFSVMLFLLYYLLKDGKEFTGYLKGIIPLPEDIVNRLHRKTYQTTWAVIKGHILVAVIQGLIAGVGLWFTGVPNFAFWTFVMILLAFIPIIGAFMVWGPASIYLLAINRPIAAIVLAVYGSIVVGLTDNFLRPLLVDRSGDLHPAVILIGVIGGVYVFGAAGLFIGPVVFGVLKAVLEVFKSNYQDL